MKKVTTTKIGGGADYAKVSDRLLEFRKDCPRGSITTEPVLIEGKLSHFIATVIKDRADEYSAQATGTGFLYEEKGKKALEKVETIAIGRALANIGYAAGGEIASSEEMERFLEDKEIKLFEKIESITDKEELRTLYANNKGAGSNVLAKITERAKELDENS